MKHQVVVNMPCTAGESYGVPIEKVWKAHFHITVSDVSSEQLMAAAKVIGAKCTTIDLHRDAHSQRDRMLTKYQVGVDTTLMLDCVRKLEEAGFKVIRYKLEQMFQTMAELWEQPLDEEHYGEVHIKTPSSQPKIETGFFQISSNAEEVDYRFYNARLYNDEDKLKFFEAKGILLLNGIQIKGQHIERVVVDSNYNLDAWWA